LVCCAATKTGSSMSINNANTENLFIALSSFRGARTIKLKNYFCSIVLPLSDGMFRVF
jgi:hypothetical protein